MPKTYHNAGKSTRDMADNRRSQLLNGGILAICAIVILGILQSNSAQLQIGGIGFLVIIVAMRFVLDYFDVYSTKKVKTIRQADRGAAAEEIIGELLDQLDEDFVVIHDVASSYGNIDHVVISRLGGIYLLETKSHRGTVTTTDGEILVNGHEPEKDFAGQALQNSYWLREEISELLQVSPWITPLVVFTHAFVKYGSPVKGVRVINRKFLLKTLQYTRPYSTINTVVWDNRERIVCLLTGQPVPAPAVAEPSRFCPRCGKVLVEKMAKGGSQVGKRFWVCPDYPQCKTAIPVE